MSFSEFLQQFMSGFNGVLEHISIYFAMLMENNLVKLVVFSSLISIIFWLLFQIYNIFITVFSPKEKATKQKNSKIE